MFHLDLRPNSRVPSGNNGLILVALICINLFFNVLANASFKLSAANSGWRNFLVWQVVGNLAGLVTVLTLTGLLRYLPLRIAYPVTAGLAVIGVQVFAARYYFGEPISPVQWLGTFFVAAGIVLIGGK